MTVIPHDDGPEFSGCTYRVGPGNTHRWRAVAIGAMVFSVGAVFGRFAGGLSMNPACTLATNIMEGKLEVLPAYALGTTVGCYLGFWTFSRVQPYLDRRLATR